MRGNVRDNIRTVTITGLLTALAIVAPLFMPKLPVPEPFSVTIASHVAVILAMFVNPFAVVCSVIGSTIAFLNILGPIVAMRAFSHLIFTLVGYFLLKKRYNLILVILITAVLHALGEVLVVALLMPAATPTFIWGITGGVTVLHHCFDFAIAMVIYKALSVSPNLVPLQKVNLKQFKA